VVVVEGTVVDVTGAVGGGAGRVVGDGFFCLATVVGEGSPAGKATVVEVVVLEVALVVELGLVVEDGLVPLGVRILPPRSGAGNAPPYCGNDASAWAM
jgi:hypothetical protein